jgi:hypothetical protein
MLMLFDGSRIGSQNNSILVGRVAGKQSVLMSVIGWGSELMWLALAGCGSIKLFRAGLY